MFSPSLQIKHRLTSSSAFARKRLGKAFVFFYISFVCASIFVFVCRSPSFGITCVVHAWDIGAGVLMKRVFARHVVLLGCPFTSVHVFVVFIELSCIGGAILLHVLSSVFVTVVASIQLHVLLVVAIQCATGGATLLHELLVVATLCSVLLHVLLIVTARLLRVVTGILVHVLMVVALSPS